MNPYTNLVTSCQFRGREYLVNLRLIKETEVMEVKVTDKKTAEEWLGSYNASYIENLAHKTGNYKRFDTFVSMLKSGLLNTSHCVTLELLTFEDLEMLRSRASNPKSFPVNNSHVLSSSTNNRRYLILTYTVEFDRIHYPLALEYCGPPDPRVLQDTIQRLEKQVADLQFKLDNNDWSHVQREVDALQKKVVDVTTENIMLKEQIKKLTQFPNDKYFNKEIDTLMKYTYTLENKLQFERDSLEKLQKENLQLSSQLKEALKNEKLLRAQLISGPDEELNSREGRGLKKIHSLSPKRNAYRPTLNCAEKPFIRYRPKSGERKVYSARSCIDIIHSSGEESVDVDKRKYKKSFMLATPRSRASSPSFSDLSHNSEISRCACRNCLRTKFTRKEDQSISSRTKEKSRGKAKLLKRIQSLEKLISGIVLN